MQYVEGTDLSDRVREKGPFSVQQAINYRTSHQIRRSADCLSDGAVSDVDGNE